MFGVSCFSVFSVWSCFFGLKGFGDEISYVEREREKKEEIEKSTQFYLLMRSRVKVLKTVTVSCQGCLNMENLKNFQMM